jgi:GT2 family glycosyltransferase
MPVSSDPPIASIVLWSLAVVVAPITVYWAFGLARALRMGARDRSVRSGLDGAPPEGDGGRVSIVVPAHDEERLIERCVRSLLGQTYADLEVVVVLDRCRDRSAGILAAIAEEDDRLVVIEIDACPTEWAGKCHAAWQGAQRAGGAWLLFTDADTEFDPRLVEASLAIAARRGAALLSLLSTLTCERTFERVAQPVASLALIHMYPPERVDQGDRARPFANGQFLLFRREMYDRVGGHEAMREHLLEDIAFARAVHHAGGSCAVLLADGMLRCSMYDAYPSFREGWKRIYIEACKRKPWRLRKAGLRLLALGALMPLVQAVAVVAAIILAGPGDVVPAAAVVILVAAAWGLQAATLAIAYALAGVPRSAIALFPAGAWIVGRLMLEGARDLECRRPVRWGGKEYVLEPRS